MSESDPNPSPEPGCLPPAVRLTLLVAGACRQFDRLARRHGRWRPVWFPALVGVVEHPTAGVVLFDTGYSPRFQEATARLPYRLHRWATPVVCPAEETAAAQLAAAGIAPERVSTIVISHFHADHVGGLGDFPAARLVYLRAALDPGWRTRSGLANVRHGMLPSQLPTDLADRSSLVDECRRVPVPGLEPEIGANLGAGYDLLGDGSLIGFDLSGHVPGQLGLLLPGTQGPPVLLVGDACWNRRAFTHGELPHPVVRLLTADPAGYRRRIGAIGRLASARPGLVVVPSHCPVSIDQARRALDA